MKQDIIKTSRVRVKKGTTVIEARNSEIGEKVKKKVKALREIIHLVI